MAKEVNPRNEFSLCQCVGGACPCGCADGQGNTHFHLWDKNGNAGRRVYSLEVAFEELNTLAASNLIAPEFVDAIKVQIAKSGLPGDRDEADEAEDQAIAELKRAAQRSQFPRKNVSGILPAGRPV